MSSREAILNRLRAVQPASIPLANLPTLGPVFADRVAAFQVALARMGGVWQDLSPGASVADSVSALFPNAAVVCSTIADLAGTRVLSSTTDPRTLDDVDVGVVRAAFGVAETGSVWLSEREYGVNALGYLAQHLVVLLDPADIVNNLHDAYARPEFSQARYCVLVTGPSATADIEGVLVRGAQGVRSLTILPIAR